MMKFFDAARLFSDCWHLYRRYYGQDMTEEQSDGFAGKADALYKKYRKDKFAKEMILAIANEIERVDRMRHRTEEEYLDGERAYYPRVPKQTKDG